MGIESNRARLSNYWRQHRVIKDKSKVAQRAKGRKLSNNNNCLTTNTSMFEAAIHSIRITRLWSQAKELALLALSHTLWIMLNTFQQWLLLVKSWCALGICPDAPVKSEAKAASTDISNAAWLKTHLFDPDFESVHIEDKEFCRESYLAWQIEHMRHGIAGCLPIWLCDNWAVSWTKPSELFDKDWSWDIFS